MPSTGNLQTLAPQLDFLELAGLLQLKVAGDPFPHSFIHEVSAYSAAPEDLVRGLDPAPGTDGKETAWYLCSPVNGHQSAERRNRQVGGGGGHMFWHPEGGTRPIQGPDGKSVGAYRRTLSYVRKVKNPPGTASKAHRNIRQGWCMIEVGLLKQHAPAGAGHHWEICKVYRSPSPPSRADLAETSTAAVTGMSGVELQQHDSTPEAGAIPEVSGGGTPCPPAPLPSSCAFKQETLAIVNKSNAAATVVMKIDGSSIASAKQMKEMANLVLSSPAIAGIVLSATGISTFTILRDAINAREAIEIHKLGFANGIRILHHCTIDELGLDKSIISGYLDELEQHLQNIYLTKELSPSTRDYLVSFGERMSTIVFYEYLSKLGKGTMQEWELRTITTFGGDGSDLTAAIIGRELGSKEIQVWYDKCSIFTCDPDVYANAIPIPCLTFDEAAELGFFSGKKSMQVVKEGGIKVIIKDPCNPEADGTMITKTRDMSKCTLTSIVLKSNITMLDIEATSICMLDQKAFVEKAISVFDILKYWSIDTEWVANTHGKISLALVPPKFRYNHKLSQQALDNAVQELKFFASVDRLNNKSVISLIGNPHMLTSILEKASSVLQSNHIAIQKAPAPQGLSKVKVSLVVDDSEGERCVELLHQAFFENTDDYFPAIVNSSAVARSCDKRKADDSLLLESSERADLSSQFYTGGEGVEPTSTYKVASAHHTQRMASEDTRWVVFYASDLGAVSLLAFRGGELLLQQETLRLALYDDDQVFVDARFLREGETIDEGGWVPFPCHIVRVSHRVVHEGGCNALMHGSNMHGGMDAIGLDMDAMTSGFELTPWGSDTCPALEELMTASSMSSQSSFGQGSDMCPALEELMAASCTSSQSSFGRAVAGQGSDMCPTLDKLIAASPTSSQSSSGRAVAGQGMVDDNEEHRRGQRRKVSNRLSARRLRMQKQQYLEELRGTVARFRAENRLMATKIHSMAQNELAVRCQNALLRAEAAELTRRLRQARRILGLQ